MLEEMETLRGDSLLASQLRDTIAISDKDKSELLESSNKRDQEKDKLLGEMEALRRDMDGSKTRIAGDYHPPPPPPFSFAFHTFTLSA